MAARARRRAASRHTGRRRAGAERAVQHLPDHRAPGAPRPRGRGAHRAPQGARNVRRSTQGDAEPAAHVVHRGHGGAGPPTGSEARRRRRHRRRGRCRRQARPARARQGAAAGTCPVRRRRTDGRRDRVPRQRTVRRHRRTADHRRVALQAARRAVRRRARGCRRDHRDRAGARPRRPDSSGRTPARRCCCSPAAARTMPGVPSSTSARCTGATGTGSSPASAARVRDPAAIRSPGDRSPLPSGTRRRSAYPPAGRWPAPCPCSWADSRPTAGRSAPHWARTAACRCRARSAR